MFEQLQHFSLLRTEHLEKMQYPSVFNKSVPSVYTWIMKSLEGTGVAPMLYIPNICTNTYNVVSVSIQHRLAKLSYYFCM